MPKFVKSVSAESIYGRLDFEQQFEEGVNILHGKNGTGKTTLLHILANVLNGDYFRFVYLSFSIIEVRFDDGSIIAITREPIEDDERIRVRQDGEELCSFTVKSIKREFRRRTMPGQASLFEERPEEFKSILSTDYFPAFRTMIEAWASLPLESLPPRFRQKDKQERATLMARDLFGNFVPSLNYPSPTEIQRRLSEEVTASIINVGRGDQELLSRAFLETFSALFSSGEKPKEDPENILEQIRSLSENLESSPSPYGYFSTPVPTYEALKQKVSSLKVGEEVEQAVIRILNVYRDTLAKRTRIQKAAYEGIERYLDAVNEFLEGKSFEMRLKEEVFHTENLVKIIFDDGQVSGLETLSSGERQIVTLIYAATHMNKQRVVLIDEPELSLHIDWQRSLLKKMAEQLGDRQIIACTHSPVIGADYQGHMKEVNSYRVSLRNQHDEHLPQESQS